MHTKEYGIKFYEKDFRDRLKETVLLNFMQDIASEHAEMLGFGFSHIMPKNLGWFLLKYHIKVHRWACKMDKIILKTWPWGVKKFYCMRDFEVCSPGGERLISASSSWGICDMETKKIVNPMEVLESFPKSDLRALETTFPKVQDVKDVFAQKTFEVRYDDIDINQHVNNACYLGWALDTLDSDFRSKNKIGEMELLFKKELKFGGCVNSVMEYDKEKHLSLHTLKNRATEEILCNIRIKWLK